MPVVKDPRSYIKRVPVPVPSHVGMKIQTRSITHYRATTPVTDKRPTPSLLVTPKESISYEDTQSQGTETSVDDADMTQGMVNYYRRLDQQLTQGYNAPKNRPYQGIGDPFYLDEEELILHSLGQWHPSHQIEQDNSDDDDMIETISSVKQLQKNMGSSAKMMLSKPRKDLNTLSKEIAHGRNMIRNVKLGHGLFDLIKHERDAKKIAEEEQDKKKMLAMRNQWQPPKEQTSSDEESEEDLEQDVDLTGYMQSNGKETDEEIEEGKIFITEENVDDDASVKDRDQEIETVTAMSSRPITGQFPARKKKKQKQPRPYTPLHNSIVEKREFGKSMNQREATEVRESPKDHPAAQ
ncbi:hypothetical protein KUTeg_000346 [Tegillarca granosa]|nr:hypothetical protein KUTeg_000346 [Tegillarca granosa]